MLQFSKTAPLPLHPYPQRTRKGTTTKQERTAGRVTF
jgi:hypothetical protein